MLWCLGTPTLKFQFQWYLRSREEFVSMCICIYGSKMVCIFKKEKNPTHLSISFFWKEDTVLLGMPQDSAQGGTFPTPGLSSPLYAENYHHETRRFLHPPRHKHNAHLDSWSTLYLHLKLAFFPPLESYRACLIITNENGFLHTTCSFLFRCVFNTNPFPLGKWPSLSGSPPRSTE